MRRSIREQVSWRYAIILSFYNTLYRHPYIPVIESNRSIFRMLMAIEHSQQRAKYSTHNRMMAFSSEYRWNGQKKSQVPTTHRRGGRAENAKK